LARLHRERVRRALYLLENTTHPVDRIGHPTSVSARRWPL
jgi:hypothetical protein